MPSRDLTMERLHTPEEPRHKHYSWTDKEPIAPTWKTIWFYGIDPASTVDYFGVVIHGLPPPPRNDTPWQPRLADLYRLPHGRYKDSLAFLVNTLFKQFPPFKLRIDITKAPYLGETILEMFGEQVVTAKNFSNVGNSNTKFEMKQVGMQFLTDGYTFPNHNKIREVNGHKADILLSLETEMLHEMTKMTSAGRLSFDSPSGKHNDLVHAWEMSLVEVIEYQRNKTLAQHHYPRAIAGPNKSEADEEWEREGALTQYDGNIGQI